MIIVLKGYSGPITLKNETLFPFTVNTNVGIHNNSHKRISFRFIIKTKT